MFVMHLAHTTHTITPAHVAQTQIHVASCRFVWFYLSSRSLQHNISIKCMQKHLVSMLFEKFGFFFSSSTHCMHIIWNYDVKIAVVYVSCQIQNNSKYTYTCFCFQNVDKQLSFSPHTYQKIIGCVEKSCSCTYAF